jgi:pimeloyl-[acyl-carrier protein] methyl ester esterase
MSLGFLMGEVVAHLAVEGDRRIYFEHYPGAREVTVVLSHGWGMACRVWDNTTACLQDAGVGVVAYDHRNCGRSDKDFRDVSISALGDDVVALCDHLGLGGVVVNGWSLGGVVVTDAAAKLGDRLAGLILTAAASPRYTQADGFPYGGQPEDVTATVAALRADRVNFLRTLYYEGAYAKDVGEAVKNWCWQISLQASPGADASLGALANVDYREAMTQIAAPALVYVGALDGVADPGIGRTAAELLPNGRLVEMADCGHTPFLEDPEAYHRALLEFLGELGNG